MVGFRQKRGVWFMCRLAAICFLFLAAQLSPAQKQPAPLTPAEIFARVTTVYASCQSYSDEGETTTTVGLKSATPRPFTEPFTTAFVRPNAFRFWFHAGAAQLDLTFVAWKAGRLEKGFWPNNRAGLGHQDLSEILMSIFLQSHGAAMGLQALLMPNISHGKGLFASLTNVKLGKEEKIERRRAFKIEALLDNEPFNLWIDANEFLILQTEHSPKIGKLDSHTITRYRPVLDREIPADKLAFNAPGVVE